MGYKHVVWVGYDMWCGTDMICGLKAACMRFVCGVGTDVVSGRGGMWIIVSLPTELSKSAPTKKILPHVPSLAMSPDVVSPESGPSDASFPELDCLF